MYGGRGTVDTIGAWNYEITVPLNLASLNLTIARQIPYSEKFLLSMMADTQ